MSSDWLDKLLNDLAEKTREGNWDSVKSMYYKFPELHTKKISDLVGTALHVAVDLDEEDVVEDLVYAILRHHPNPREEIRQRQDTALEVVNERGDTPLHLAASRGFAGICKIIIGTKKERIYLLSRRNNLGETPVFLAALNWHKEAFAYLHHISKGRLTWQDLVRKDGDSILHTAIEREYFDLAVIIVHYYDYLNTKSNGKGATPLKILATRPSAFKSGSNLSWYERILYQCILVENLEDADRRMNSYLTKMDDHKKNKVEDSSAKMKFPANCCIVLYDFVSTILPKFATPFAGKKKKQQDTENPSYKCCPDKYTPGFFPPNYETFHQFIKSAYVNTLRLSGVELKDVKNAKEKHQWSGQLLKDLMKRRPSDALTGKGGQPSDTDFDEELYNVFPQWQESSEDEEEQEVEADGINEITPTENKRNENTKTENENELVDKKETPSLAAARNGIVEIVQEKEILKQIPSSSHNTNSKKENEEESVDKKETPFLAAARNEIVQEILKQISASHDTNSKKENEEESVDKKETPFLAVARNDIVEIVQEILEKIPSVIHDTNSKKENEEESVDKKETPFLAAARNGIVEIVQEILEKIPGAIHDTNSKKENESVDKKETPFLDAAKNGIVEIVQEILEKIHDTNSKKESVDKKETALLAAARYGIVEIVQKIMEKMPSAIHDTNSKKENVLMVAVKHRQPLIVQTLQTIIIKKKLWSNLILGVDDQENTMLHLAAEALGGDKPRQIAGSALQMMWDIKWFQNITKNWSMKVDVSDTSTFVDQFLLILCDRENTLTLEQYIKTLVPDHFYFRSNKSGETAGEIFKRTHKDHIKESGDWLKDTSESCSVVAALVAGVSFATASTIPGGNTPEGVPVLEGQPAFDTFAIASLIGLCFSVTGLIMFLSILTSRKEANDFRKDLPLKLLLGLSSLFVSIAALFVSFCTGHFFLLNHEYKSVMFPFYAATCVPVTFYAVAQFPLYFDLLMAILTDVPMVADKSGTL